MLLRHTFEINWFAIKVQQCKSCVEASAEGTVVWSVNVVQLFVFANRIIMGFMKIMKFSNFLNFLIRWLHSKFPIQFNVTL